MKLVSVVGFGMLDWLGTLEIQEKNEAKLKVGSTALSRNVGWALLVFGGLGSLLLWSDSPWRGFGPGLLAIIGALLATLKREIVVDKRAGVVRVKQSVLGLGSQSEIPLFHLRAVVIFAKPKELRPWWEFSIGPRYVAYLDKRVGDAVYLDESRKCASLLKLGEAISDMADVRLEYDAT